MTDFQRSDQITTGEKEMVIIVSDGTVLHWNHCRKCRDTTSHNAPRSLTATHQHEHERGDGEIVGQRCGPERGDSNRLGQTQQRCSGTDSI